MAEINLLPEQERKAVAVKRLKNRVTIFSVVSLILAALLSIAVFGYWGVLIAQEKQLGDKLSKLEQQIEGLKTVEGLARVLKNKLAALTVISGKLTNFDKVLTDITQVVPAGVTFSDLTVSDKGILTLTGNAATATEFSNLVTALLHQDAGGANFSDVAVESLSRDEKGIYKFSISAKLKIAQKQ